MLQAIANSAQGTMTVDMEDVEMWGIVTVILRLWLTILSVDPPTNFV